MFDAETLLRMRRDYTTEYDRNGGDVHGAMRWVLERYKVPSCFWGQVSDEVKNFRSETIIALPRGVAWTPDEKLTVRYRLRNMKTDNRSKSLPNGDRD